MQYVIFHDGQVLPELITENIIKAARRGLITRVGEKLLLVPDTRFGGSDIFGLREFANGQVLNKGSSRQRRLPRLSKADCIPLKNLAGLRKRQKSVSDPSVYAASRRQKRRSDTYLPETRFSPMVVVS